MAFLNMARDYADTANELFMIADARPKIQDRHLPLSSPLYLLYSHAAELALKAFLGAKNIPTFERHEFAKLYEKSQRAGLVMNHRFEIGNLMAYKVMPIWLFSETPFRHSTFNQKAFSPSSMASKVTIYSPVRSENPLSNSIAAIRHSLAPIENALLKPSGVDGSIPIGGKRVAVDARSPKEVIRLG